MDKSKLTRRGILGTGAAAGLGLAGAGQATTPSPSQPSGPFYPIRPQADRDADLTRVDGQEGVALGEVIYIQGRVRDEEDHPIEGALVDIWQANAAGRYAHERDPNPAPLDPNFQGWAMITTDAYGFYSFRTVRPGAYPAGDGWVRPPHIHFRISRRGFHELTTQMYFGDEALNAEDRLLRAVPAEERHRLIVGRVSPDMPFQFDITLARV